MTRISQQARRGERGEEKFHDVEPPAQSPVEHPTEGRRVKRKRANPNECFHCGKPVGSGQPGSIRFHFSDVVFCDRSCWDARPAEMKAVRQRQTSVHEAGHCLGARLAKSEITIATIEPDGVKSEGHIRSTTLRWEDSITELLLGHAAEREFGFDGKGHGSDYERAEKELKEMMKHRKHGDATLRTARWQFSSDALWRRHLMRLRMTRKEWKPEYDKRVRKARRLAKKYRAWIEHVAKLLLEKRTLTDKDIPPV